MSPAPVRIERDGDVAVVVLDAPPLNLFDEAVFTGFETAVGELVGLTDPARPARAKELIYSGERYPAAVLERWNVVSRALPDEGFAEAAREYARRVAAGPTVAHAATKRLAGTAVRHGVPAADGLTPSLSAALFATGDLRGALRSSPKGPAGRPIAGADPIGSRRGSWGSARVDSPVF